MGKELILDVVAKKHSKELSQLADEFEMVGKQADLLGAQIKKTGTFSQFLDEELEKTKIKVRELGEEFDRTGDKDVFGKLKGAQANVKSLERIKKDLATALEDGVVEAGDVIQKRGGLLGLMSKGGKGLAGLFGIGSGSPEAESGLTGIAKAIFTNPVGIAGATGVAAVAGEMIGGAVLTGIGLAGIGAGIALVFKDPRIQPALAAFKHDVGTGLKDAAEPFVEPLQQGLVILDRGFKAELPGIKKMFADIAPEVTGLAHGVSGFLSGVTRGLEDAAVASKPLVHDFTGWMPQFGSEIGSLFTTIGQHSKGAQQGLQTLETGLSGLVVTARDAIPVIDKLAQGIDYISLISWEKKFYGIKDTVPRFGQLAGAVVDLVDKDKLLSDATDTLTRATRSLNDEFTTEINKQLMLSGDADAFQKMLLDEANAVDKHSRSLKDNSLAGLDNRDVLRQLVTAAEKQREDAITAAGGQHASADAIDAANQKYRDQIKQIEDHTAKLGFDKKAVDDFVTALDGIPTSKKITITMVTNGDTTLLGGTGLKFKAAGGPVAAGQPYIVGEKHPELFVPDQPGTIVPDFGDGPRYGAGNSPTGGGSGGTNIYITVNAGMGTDGRAVGEQIRNELLNLSRRSGFRSVDQLLPVGSAR